MNRYIVRHWHDEYIEDAHTAADALTQHHARYPAHDAMGGVPVTVRPYVPNETPCKYRYNRARQPPGLFCCCGKTPDEIGAPHYHYGVDQRQPDGVECTCRNSARRAPHIHSGESVAYREPQP